jgi:hypothetical protein
MGKPIVSRRLLCVLALALLSPVLAAIAASSALASFGFQKAENTITEENGSPDVQAGSHPFAINTTFKLNERVQPSGVSIPDGDLKDVEVKLPPGLTGNATAVPKCSVEQFNTRNPHLSAGLSGASCPADTQIGIARVELNTAGEAIPPGSLYFGVYNLVPPPGVPAAFGFNPLGLAVVLTAKVRTGEDYGVSVDSNNDSQLQRIYGVTTTLWGVPYDHSHDSQRGECLGFNGVSLGTCPMERAPRPLLRMPTSCSSSPPATLVFADSWQNPVSSLELQGVEAELFNRDLEGDPVGVEGCDRLPFSPAARVGAESSSAASPTGLAYELSLPQSESPAGLAESDLRDAVVTLPAGMTVSPSAADGLGACTDTPEPGRPEGQIALHSASRVECPDSSKLGTVEVQTPLLEAPLKGSVFLAQPNANEFDSLLALYIVAEGDGVLIKLAAHAEANPLTGQLTTVVRESPQQPFSNLKLHFFGGPRAALMTPQACGTYHATSQLTPWSSPAQTALSIDSPFNITASCGGGFSPTLTAGTTSNRAGAFSPFTTTISRSDQDQNLSSITVRNPPGLLGMLSNLTLCGEPQAQQGACPATSQIGHVTVSAGAGPTPLQLPLAGKPQDPVFLTGAYKGAPFGLSIVVPAEAGPFNLGNVITRAAITVDPHTAQVTIASDPLRSFLQGIPLDVRTVNVIVDREGFIFNPTNCQPSSVGSTITSTQGASAVLSSRFQAADCASLPFKPAFAASTQGNGNFHGASLDVKISQRPGEAAIGKLTTQLPLALSSRLATLQKACPEAKFTADPAGCPAGSVVGHATAVTPVLNVPLTGPAYLVSHGGAAFPDLDIILQGEGVKIILTGNTDIKKGITYSRFETVPDAPIKSFELNLPGGPGAVLAATKNLCRPSKTVTVTKRLTRRVHGHPKRVKVKVRRSVPDPLLMPTTLTGQNGAVVKQNTKIAVTGCAMHSAKSRKAGRGRHGGRRR